MADPEDDSLEGLFKRYVKGQLSTQEAEASRAPLQEFAERLRLEQVAAARAALVTAGEMEPCRDDCGDSLVLRFGHPMQGIHAEMEMVVGVGTATEMQRWLVLLELVRAAFGAGAMRYAIAPIRPSLVEEFDTSRPTVRYYDPVTGGSGVVYADVLGSVAAVEIRPIE